MSLIKKYLLPKAFIVLTSFTIWRKNSPVNIFGCWFSHNWEKYTQFIGIHFIWYWKTFPLLKQLSQTNNTVFNSNNVKMLYRQSHQIKPQHQFLCKNSNRLTMNRKFWSLSGSIYYQKQSPSHFAIYIFNVYKIFSVYERFFTLYDSKDVLFRYQMKL